MTRSEHTLEDDLPRMKMRGPVVLGRCAPSTARLAWVLCAVAVALLATSVVLAIANGLESSEDWGTGAYPLLVCIPAATFPVVGALIASRRPGNAVGWVCLAIGLGIGAQLAATRYAAYALDTDPQATSAERWVAWYGAWASFPYTASLFVILLFPDGRLPSRRWRGVAGLAAVGILATNVTDALLPGVMAPLSITNPLGLDGAKAALQAINAVAFPLTALGALGAGASIVVRFRRGRGIERQQVKWFAFVATLLAIAVPFEGTTPLVQDLVTVLFAGLPAAAGIAILRHGLYDIDVVINRTLVYGALTATLAVAYLSAVLLLQLVLSPSSDIAIAVSTLAVAALFRPARARIQEVVDRRFYRHKYDATRTLEIFGARVRNEVDLTQLEADLRAVVSETMQSADVSLWLRQH
jgi:hypothetical protein